MEQSDEHSIDVGQKIRYEAFMKFASDAGEARTLASITTILESNLKYVVNTFIARFWAVVGHKQIVYEVHRNQGLLNQVQYEPSSIEMSAIIKKLPMHFTKAEITNYSEWNDSIFNHPKVQHFCVMPIIFSPTQTLVISIAYKEDTPYNQLDYRFLKLTGEFLLNKISELLLLARIEEKNKELAETNIKLDSLNAQISNVNKNLEHLVNKRTEELRLANQELYTLFYRTSHDFRRPLATISGLLHWAENSAEKQEINQILGTCQLEIKHLYRMLDKLSKISLNEMEEKEDIERVDFEKILQQLSQSFKSDLNKHSIRASHQINLTADFWGNEEIIQTIMENIFENAIQYFDDKKTERWIKTEITNSDQQLLIQIMDNGVGIETELQSRIFDMYFKDNEKSKGNGLGLYVTRKLVKKLHGKISIWSTVCEGTIFIVKLPLVSAGV